MKNKPRKSHVSETLVPLIRFDNVSKSFGKLEVLKNLSFSIYPQEVTAIIGKSGVGKSVLLKLIIGLVQPDTGRITLHGTDLSTVNGKDKSRLKAQIGYMFQNSALFDSMTIFDNVALPLLEKSTMTKIEIRKRVQDKLRKLEIWGARSKFPSEVSGGMKKRAALARALITDPELVLFDEPTTGLDPIRKNAVHSMISHMQQKFNFTAIVVSHEIPDIFYISQRIIMLDEGKIIADCRPDEVEEVNNPVVHAFLEHTEVSKPPSETHYIKRPILHKFKKTFANFIDSKNRCGIMVFCIDQLEIINEKSSFVIGQKVLNHLTSAIEHALEISRHDFRYHKDHIIVILPEEKIIDYQKALCKLKKELCSYSPLIHQGVEEPMHYSIKVGFCGIKDCASIEKMIEPVTENMIPIAQFELR